MIRTQPTTMEIEGIVEHDHWWCKLNDEHNKTHNTQSWEWKLKCWNSNVSLGLSNPKLDTIIETKTHKNFVQQNNLKLT
jgi:hypothetical protein